MGRAPTPPSGAAVKSSVAELRVLLANAKLLAGDPEAALASAEIASRVDAKMLALERTIVAARAWNAMGEERKTVDELEGRIDPGPSDPRLLFTLAEALVATGAHDAAERVLRRPEIARAPSSTYQRGVIAFDRGDFKGATPLFRETIDADPNDFYARVYYVRSLLERDDASTRAVLEAIDGARKIAKTPELDYLEGLARARSDDGLPAAIGAFRRAIAADPGYAEALFALAGVQRRSGDRDGARRSLEAFRARQQAHWKSSREANRLEQRALAAPDDWHRALDAAESYRRSGSLDSAVRLAWRAIRTAPDESEPRLSLARSLRDSGRYSEAAVQYQRILRRHATHEDARRELSAMVREHARGGSR